VNNILADAADQTRSADSTIGDIASTMKDKMALVPGYEEDFRGEESKDGIMIAAKQVSSATRAAQAPVIPEQKTLLAIAASVASEMEKLSKAAASGSKAGMIASGT